MDSSEGRESAPGGWYPDPLGGQQLRYWDGSSWTNFTTAAEPPASEQPAPPAVEIPPVQPSRLSRPLPKGFARRVFWSIYAIPVTILLLAASVAGLGNGSVYVVDAIVSLPQFIAMQLYIWDKRALRPWVWRIYAVGFLGWQLAFGFYIEPKMSGTSLGAGTFMGFAVQLPMLVAIFLYAFGSRVGVSEAPDQAQKKGTGSAAVLVTTIVGLAAVVVVVAGWITARQMPSYLATLTAPTYEVSVPPPHTILHGPARPGLSAEESARLRALFDAGDYASLNSSLSAIQGSFEASSTNDRRVADAFGLFKRPKDNARLDAWVAHDPSQYAPYLARAEYQYAAGRAARGSAWARDTSAEQFRQMGQHFVDAQQDIDAALARNSNLVDAYCLRIDIANADGSGAEEDVIIRKALASFPHSYVLYSGVLYAKRPRWGGSYKEMERYVKQAVAENPGDLGMVSLFGEVYTDQANLAALADNYDRALELYSKASSYGESGSLLDDRGWAYYRVDKGEQAFSDANKAIEWGDCDVSAYTLRAAIYLDRRNVELAKTDLATATALSPGNSDVAALQAAAARLSKKQ